MIEAHPPSESQNPNTCLYTILAPFYDPVVRWVSSRARQRSLQWLDVQDGETVVDVGIGTGLSLPLLLAANPSGRTIGVDATPAMLRRARRRAEAIASRSLGANVHLLRGDATALPLPDATADAVFCSYVLDTMAAPTRRMAVNEMRRILRPGGRMVLVYLTRPDTISFPTRFWLGLARVAPRVLGRARPISTPVQPMDSTFTVVRQTTVQQWGLPSEIVVCRME